MTPRMLATVTKALRDSGSREIPVTAIPVGVIGQFRRNVMAIIISLLALPVVSKVFELDSKPYLVVFLTQTVMVLLSALILIQALAWTLKGDPLLGGARSGLIVITSRGLRLFPLRGLRRLQPIALTLDLEDLAFAHVEPRRSAIDLPRFVFGHLGGSMSYEIAGKYVLQLRQAIERLEESADR